MEKLMGIMGGGNMGEALIAGVIQSGLLTPREILFHEPRPERAKYLQEKFEVTPVASNSQLPSRASTLILAVKPQTVPEVLPEIGSLLTPHHLLISICAGVPLSYIRSFFPRPVRMVRAMPNTPALIQKGATALAPSPEARPEDISTAEGIFQAVGITVLVKESQMDAVTGLSGSGPAWVFAVIEALAAGGVKEGLSQDVALNLTTQTVLGAAHLIQATGKHPATLRDQVCTPGGTTMAGLYAMEEGGLRLALMNAVIAATKRSKELGEALQPPSPPARDLKKKKRK
ncbi:MAG: Delta-1-pyrroline-5-carboxylate reductase [Deltaproteobacteria bacterium]|jgi:pyrroline-5-carboxylate reductase|nr:Delta-1-pyrroline-5-carboxylate reductase [Deltaproteobacteria bacterium]